MQGHLAMSENKLELSSLVLLTLSHQDTLHSRKF